MKQVNSDYLVRKYAQAFMQVFGASFSREDVGAMQKVAHFFHQRSRALFFLRLPIISKDIKREALYYVCTQFHVPQAAHTLIDILLEDKRSALLPLIFSKVSEIYYKIHGIEPFTIEASHALSDAQLQEIEQFLAACTGHVILSEYTVNTDLIAGVRLQSATSLWEHSIRKQLAHVQQLFMR